MFLNLINARANGNKQSITDISRCIASRNYFYISSSRNRYLNSCSSSQSNNYFQIGTLIHSFYGTFGK